MFEIINSLPIEYLPDFIEQLANDENISNTEYELYYSKALERLQKG